MRITGGNAARRILKVPKGLGVRPTPDLVKQAVFNSLGGRVAGARVLELFAGTGALSLECLSRGAAGAVCVERSSRHAEVLRQNFQIAGFPPGTLQVRVQDVFAVLSQLAAAGDQFDLIMADPPYGEKNVGRRSTSLAQQLLDDKSLPALPAFSLQKAISTTIRNHRRDYWTGTVYTTNRRVWEHDEELKKYLRRIRCMAIDMETATIFITGFHNEIPSGALLLVSDQPMVPEGIKTSTSDQKVTADYMELHLRIGIDSLCQLINQGLTVKHLRF